MMQNLFLVRHASAEDYSKNGDYGRPLSSDGWEEAEAAAKISTFALKGDTTILASGATRTLQTAESFAKALGISKDDIISSKKLYTANSPDEYFEVIHDQQIESANLFVFGHNPVITDLVQLLQPKLNFQMCKSAVVGFKVGALDHFLIPKRVSMNFFYFPKKFKIKNLHS